MNFKNFKYFILILLVCVSFGTKPNALELDPSQIKDIKSFNTSSNFIRNKNEVMPFGHTLFENNTNALRAIDPNPEYKVSVGDMINVKTWGEFNFQQSTPVDQEGNIFIPQVGPVNLEGVEQSDINTIIKDRVSSVFSDGVEVYSGIDGSNHVSVFVTGGVKTPGRYLGDSRFSIFDYIIKAGGIDNNSGSYRKIKILRNNDEFLNIDIYDFLKKGLLPDFTLIEGDTVLVEERGNVIEASGDVVNSYQFEFSEGKKILGEDIIKYASTKPGTTHVLIDGVRKNKPFKTHLTIEDFKKSILENGDMVSFSGAEYNQNISIALSGLHTGAKNMVVPIDARLSEVLNNISIHPELSNPDAIYIKRKSVAKKQKKAIQESLKKLQETILLAKTSGTEGSASVTVADAQVIDLLINKASEVEPEGRLVFSSKTDMGLISLEEGDEIVIPQKTQVVSVNGEVLIPQAVIWNNEYDVEDYIDRAGGFSDRANEDKIVVVRANGATQIGDDVDVRPGDEILILPEIKFNDLELTGRVIDIIYKVAVAAVIPFRL